MLSVRFTTAVVLVGCAPADPGPLVALDGWTRVEGVDDPFAGEGGPDSPCPDDAFKIYPFGGEDSLDVSTDLCARITIARPALRGARRGDRVTLRGWHELLTAVEPADAVVALAVDGVERWRATYPIPSDGSIMLGDEEITEPWEAGAQVAWHVHNHGKNSYHLFEVQVVARGTEDP